MEINDSLSLNFINYPAICIWRLQDAGCGITKIMNFLLRVHATKSQSATGKLQDAGCQTCAQKISLYLASSIPQPTKCGMWNDKSTKVFCCVLPQQKSQNKSDTVNKIWREAVIYFHSLFSPVREVVIYFHFLVSSMRKGLISCLYCIFEFYVV